MKPTIKIVLLLGAVIVAGSAIAWLCYQPRRQSATAGPAPASRPSSARSPTSHFAPTTPVPAPSVLDIAPVSVRAIMGASPAATFAERVQAVLALPAELTAQEVNAFYTYLLTPSVPDNRSSE